MEFKNITDSQASAAYRDLQEVQFLLKIAEGNMKRVDNPVYFRGDEKDKKKFIRDNKRYIKRLQGIREESLKIVDAWKKEKNADRMYSI